jgi:alkylation response protein AidB-like acyl-CoA dehydrogenase
MDFNDSPEEAEFRRQVRAWLAENTSEFSAYDYDTMPDEEEVALCRRWVARKAEAGYAAMRLPRAYGGMDAAPMQCVIYTQEEARYRLPFNYFGITLGMAVPTLLTFASEEHKAALLPQILSGEHIWCQLFSEPSAGSDLANLRTRAEREGDEWVINGQKVWTTGAHLADYGILVARSNPELPKHRGLTYFFLDMKSPGVEVRPITQIDGGTEFNEVYFSDVRVPDSQRLGEVGEGWKVAMTTLMFERQAAGEQSLGLIDFEDLFQIALGIALADGPAIEDSQVREKLVDWYLIQEGLKYFGYRQLTALSSGRPPGPEASLGKLLEARGAQVAARFATDLMGYEGIIKDPVLAPRGGVHQSTVLQAPGIRIAGGTDEILRNTLAEKVLGLPPEPRNDKTMPFNQLQS